MLPLASRAGWRSRRVLSRLKTPASQTKISLVPVWGAEPGTPATLNFSHTDGLIGYGRSPMTPHPPVLPKFTSRGEGGTGYGYLVPALRTGFGKDPHVPKSWH